MVQKGRKSGYFSTYASIQDLTHKSSIILKHIV